MKKDKLFLSLALVFIMTLSLSTLSVVLANNQDEVHEQTRGEGNNSETDAGQEGDQEQSQPENRGPEGEQPSLDSVNETSMGNANESGNGSENSEISPNAKKSGDTDPRYAMNQVSVQIKGWEDGEEDSAFAREVKTSLKSQAERQENIEENIDKLEKRSDLFKKLIGPDYGTIKLMKQQVEENKLKIKELNQLKTQTQNQSEETQLQNTIEAMEEQNTALQEKLSVEEQIKGMFGWFFKWVSEL